MSFSTEPSFEVFQSAFFREDFGLTPYFCRAFLVINSTIIAKLTIPMLSYQRRDNKHVEMVLTHVHAFPGERAAAPTLNIAIYRTVNNPNMVPSALVELSMEEARLLRDFLNRPEASAYLDGE